MTRPSRRGKNRAFLTGETGTGTPSGDDKSWDAGPYNTGSALTDHTHAATGSGPTGGGATLTPGVLNLPAATSPAQTAEGSAVWDSDDDKLTVGTGAARKTMVNEGAVTTSGLTMATGKLLGRNTASTGAIEEITLGTNLSFTGTTLNAASGGGGGLTASYVGKNAIGASWRTMSGSRILCHKFTLSATSYVIAVHAYLRPSTDNLLGLLGSVLDDNSNAPGVYRGGVGIATGNVYLSNSSSMPGAGRWVTFPIGLELAAGDYWATVASSNGIPDIAYDAGGDKYFTPSGFYLTGAYPTAWSITTSSDDYSIRVLILS